jgi:radical SAM superfamily enzyme
VEDLDEQIARGLGFLRNRYGARLFFLYFQAYSCTNLPVAQLAQVYDNAVALFGARLRAPSGAWWYPRGPTAWIGPRLSSFPPYTARGMEVWLELGLQSSNDSSLAG